MTAPTFDGTFYERLGGEAGVKKLVSAYINTLKNDPAVANLLKQYERFSLPRYESRLCEFLSGWLGGPVLYQENHGLPMLRESHRNICIDRSLMLDWVRCMQKAINETVADPALRLQLTGRFTRMAQSLVNTGS